MNKIVFLWRKNSANIGDANSGWPIYFDFPDHDEIDLDDAEQQDIALPYDRVIVGGGLIPDAEYFPRVHAKLSRMRERVLFAGVGTNSPDAQSEYPFANIGWRHAGSFLPCPCPSCMSACFDEIPEYHDEIAYYSNPEIEKLEEKFPRMENINCTMPEAVRFLASWRSVVTSSYHGAYWASLLGRDVVAASDRKKMLYPIWQMRGWNISMAREMVNTWAEIISDFIA